jgi:polyphosphate glucokinase
VEILGIDIGGSGIKAATVDVETGVLTAERFRLPTPQPATPEAVTDVVADIVRHFDWNGPFGCAFPARIKRGIAVTAANIDRAWIGTNVEEILYQKTGLRATVINDADAAGMAEMGFGAGRHRRDVVLLLTFGTGIGSALFVNETLVPNTEFGHILLHGLVAEHYASDRARKEKKLGWKRWAMRVQEYMDRIEFLLAPDLIIFGVGVSKPKKRAKFFDQIKTQADFVPAELQNHAGIVGAAYSAMALARTTTPQRPIIADAS